MTARRAAAFAVALAETIADARDELSPEEYATLLEHSLTLLAEAWAAWIIATRERAA
jgi:hypothetical protein